MTAERNAPERESAGSIHLSRRTVLAAPAALMLPRFALAQKAKVQKGQVVVGFSSEPTVLNPLMPQLEVDQGVWFALFNPLWRVEPDGTLVPELAAEVPSLENGSISADGLSWTVKLRKGVKWHDGKDFTAEDVKYTIELINNPNFKANARQGHDLVRDITIVNPYELTWKMSKAYSPYLALLALTFIVPKHALASAADPNTAPFNSAPIGTGPFKWGKRVAGQGITVEANKDYFGDGPFVERVIFNYIPDTNNLYTQFKTGQIDYIGHRGIAPQFVKEASALHDRKVEKVRFSQVEGIALNLGKPIFQDKAVRRAMYAGINKKAIIGAVYYGLPVETESIVPRSSWAFNPDLPKHAYDLALGNKALDDAGWVRGSDGIRAKGGQRLEFTAATVSGVAQREQVLQLLQQDWSKLGIAMQIKTMPAAVIWADYYLKSQFDCLLISSSYSAGADPDMTRRFSSAAIPIQGGSGNNYYQYKNPEVDRLLAVAQASFKRAERKEAYQKIQALLREDLVVLPISQTQPVEGTKAKLVGYNSNPNVQCNTWNINTWRWTT
ncbi:peptide ABC transporter substrate-binding protein [Caenimonas aquaedulcis]|uniref:Peptide ABC transporter substrate-binding protein n=1 Tax=Caenimonas aquaedulcis TaxID=2793270 RepID=A0A931H3U8_9BURK|nr:peptide ABC transporter substrate-binding protein [Caenimonas aquaedulcis]MBG9387998.1 peptide ABC transporter substrate-binding protein [Caenimonas aquaedulcis]